MDQDDDIRGLIQEDFKTIGKTALSGLLAVAALVLVCMAGCDTSPTVVVLPAGDTNQNTNIGIGVNAPAPSVAPTPTAVPTATPAARR